MAGEKGARIFAAEVPSVCDDCVALTVTSACTAAELTAALGLSKAVAGRLFVGGRLLRAGVPLRREDRLAAGERVELVLAVPAESALPTALPADSQRLEVIYEDGILLAVDKPAGILVHADGTGASTLTDAVAALLVAEGARRTPQAVQRLDVETTGLVLFSLAPEFQPTLDAQVAGHGMRKRYLAVVKGSFPAGERVIERPLGRDRHDARRMRVSPTGKPATTRVRLLACADGRSLLLVELLTGRRHQIRVHLASMGFPIVGDALYGGAPCKDGLLLHALSEDVIHTLTGEVLRLRTPWPERMGAWPWGELAALLP